MHSTTSRGNRTDRCLSVATPSNFILSRIRFVSLNASTRLNHPLHLVENMHKYTTDLITENHIGRPNGRSRYKLRCYLNDETSSSSSVGLRVVACRWEGNTMCCFWCCVLSQQSHHSGDSCSIELIDLWLSSNRSTDAIDGRFSVH